MPAQPAWISNLLDWLVAAVTVVVSKITYYWSIVKQNVKQIPLRNWYDEGILVWRRHFERIFDINLLLIIVRCLRP